nr:MAG TPA: hypothetical protein [Caudoviricetes sp.]
MRGQPHFPNLHATRAPKTRSGRLRWGGGVIPWGCWGLFFCVWLFRRRDFWCLCWSGVLVVVVAGPVCVVLCWCVSCVRACVLVVVCTCVRWCRSRWCLLVWG